MTCPPDYSRAEKCLRQHVCSLVHFLCAGLLLIFGLSSANLCQAIEVTVRELGDTALSPSEIVTKIPGDVVAVEVVVDTEGESLSGYSFGISITPGTVTGISEFQVPLPPLMNLGSPTIDEASGTISGIAQVGFFGSLPPGIYVTERIEFLVESLPPQGITIAAGFLAPSESFIVSGDTCPGTLIGCTVTFNSMKIVGGPSVPMLSPFGMFLLIGTILIASGRKLGLKPFDFRATATRGSNLGLVALVGALSLVHPVGSARAVEEGNPMQEYTLDAASPELAEKWGIEVVFIRLTAVDRFLDFRYRVVDAEKAGRLFGPGIKPILIDSSNGRISKVPVPPKLGPMKSTRGRPYEERQYFVFFANQGRAIHAGEEVAVDFGELKISGLKVQ